MQHLCLNNSFLSDIYSLRYLPARSFFAFLLLLDRLFNQQQSCMHSCWAREKRERMKPKRKDRNINIVICLLFPTRVSSHVHFGRLEWKVCLARESSTNPKSTDIWAAYDDNTRRLRTVLVLRTVVIGVQVCWSEFGHLNELYSNLYEPCDS